MKFYKAIDATFGCITTTFNTLVAKPYMWVSGGSRLDKPYIKPSDKDFMEMTQLSCLAGSAMLCSYGFILTDYIGASILLSSLTATVPPNLTSLYITQKAKDAGLDKGHKPSV
jgi:hypothetical protein